jgi:hypothetical protein
MSKANGKCNRCNGRGFRDTPVLHMGVPGLCYGCNGAGTYEAFAAVQEAARKAKAINDAFSAAYAKTNEVAENNGGRLNLDRDGRRLVQSMIAPFSSADYAKARGIDTKTAFIELCRIGRHLVCPVVGEDLKIIGWTNK